MAGAAYFDGDADAAELFAEAAETAAGNLMTSEACFRMLAAIVAAADTRAVRSPVSANRSRRMTERTSPLRSGANCATSYRLSTRWDVTMPSPPLKAQRHRQPSGRNRSPTPSHRHAPRSEIATTTQQCPPAHVSPVTNSPTTYGPISTTSACDNPRLVTHRRIRDAWSITTRGPCSEPPPKRSDRRIRRCSLGSRITPTAVRRRPPVGIPPFRGGMVYEETPCQRYGGSTTRSSGRGR